MNEELSATGTRLINLRAKLQARKGKPGMEKNCEAIEAEIARLEGSTRTPAGGGTVADSDGSDGT